MIKIPAITIIIPCYNRAYIISRAINSVLNQTSNNWQLIVVDDGSTDDTETVVKKINDERIIYHKQTNKGPSAARNKGVSLAKSKWVTYLDSDDTLYDTYVETMLEWLEKNPKTVYGIIRARRTLSLYRGDRLIKSLDHSNDLPFDVTESDIFMKRFHFSSNGFVHKRDVFDGIIQWDEQLMHMEEWDLAMQIGERHPNSFLYVPIELCTYDQRHGVDGICSNTPYLDWAHAFEYIYQKHRGSQQLIGQEWYPQRVDKWKAIDADFQNGLLPPPNLYFFPEYYTATPSIPVVA